MSADEDADGAAGVGDRAAEWLFGADAFVGGGMGELLEAVVSVLRQAAKHPRLLAEQHGSFLRELGRIAASESTLVPEQGDARFADPAWSESSLYRAWLQTYLAWRQSMGAVLDGAGLPAKQEARARFAVSLLTEALAPTNFLLGNPAAIKRAIDTGGGSLWRGVQNFLGDFMTNGAMPSQVDRSAFQVGQNLAVTPGAVVFRNELLELIQYTPAGERVYRRPLLVVPPQINKYYFLDLAPGKSFVEHAVKSGVQPFVISWRNPTAAHRHWGLEAYLGAIEEAMAAAMAITRSPDLNVLAACAGAITLMPLLAHLAARGDTRVRSVTLLVALLDTSTDSPLGLFATRETLALARASSQLRGVLDGRALGRLFAWLRPNDLVWSYWVNNYLLGKDPPAFDVLYWNNDSTRLPARLHGEFLDLFADNALCHPGRLSLLDTPIDLGRVSADAYVVAGKTDHITPWQGCYAATRLLGGNSEFVLSSSGHVQSVINPPGNPKAAYLRAGELPADPESWLQSASRHPGSWWEHWREWIGARSGGQRRAPTALGSRRYPPLDAAPGTYVLAS